MHNFRFITTAVIQLGAAVLILAIIGISVPAEAGEKCPLGICKGERVIIFDQNHRRTHTLENRGYGVIQIRDNENLRIGTIEANGTIKDTANQRQGSVETNKWTEPGEAWK